MSTLLAGRYELGDCIGKGGMAEVFIANDQRLERTVAVKVLLPDSARDESFEERFRREAKVAAALNHPAIVGVFDTGEDITGPGGHRVSYIVMEYVAGRTVRELLAEGIGREQTLEVVAGVLSALEYSHRAGIVHRDIKPANIMVTPSGAVKVMDFGIARALDSPVSGLTQSWSVVGTAQYMSPEQARGEAVDARSDVYSTGCLLFELLTGHPLFYGESMVAVAYKHIAETPPVPSSLNPRIPAVLDQVVGKALVKDRDYRYQSADAMRADVEAVLRGEPVTLGERRAPAPPPPPPAPALPPPAPQPVAAVPASGTFHL
ncbi:MAG: protein kinase, partial [Micrococcales bacterium]|nr:protein kinase [Micrococcales bacterium]